MNNKSLKIILSYLTAGVLSISTICNNPKATKIKLPSGQELDTENLADLIEQKLKGNCVGFQFVVCFNGKILSRRAGGYARILPDKNPREMTIWDRYNIASLGKTITTVALLQILNNKSISIYSKIEPYLPSHWKVPQATKDVTFLELLQHRSGFEKSYGNSSYESIKKVFEEGPTGKKNYLYRNENFAIMRILIPNLLGEPISTVPAGLTDAKKIQEIENKQAKEYAAAYMRYCQSHIFDKLELGELFCKPTVEYPGQCYQFPHDNQPGTDFGDVTLENASGGWHMNSIELGTFLCGLHDKFVLLDTSLVKTMENGGLGYVPGWQKTPNGHEYIVAGGYYPGKSADGKKFNAGELNANLLCFKSGVRIALIMNSQYMPGRIYRSPYLALLDSYDEWIKGASGPQINNQSQ